jgi:hypothetical protein
MEREINIILYHNSTRKSHICNHLFYYHYDGMSYTWLNDKGLIDVS